MIVIKILSIALGLAFLIFGYLIYFREKYNLINGFEKDCQTGQKNEPYAKRVGKIEFIIGIALFLIGIALLIFC